MDYETGKLRDVARQQHPSLRREYGLFYAMLLLTTVPYAIAFAFKPLGTVCVMLFMAYFQVLATLARSSGTSTSHYMRFLLSGSNPVGMTGASSLLFGAVDAIVDWGEDRAERNNNQLLFALQTLVKFSLAPVGVVLLLAEFVWDLLMLRHPRIFKLKWEELFSLAEFHDIVCPEKSNDVFYADLAISRYCNDPYLYQWNRMRALVFELQQYLTDAKQGFGVPESNLILQTDVAAYQSLKRLCTEEIEAEIQQHYEEHLDEFPFPKSLATAMIKSARPTAHYVMMRGQYFESEAGKKRFAPSDLQHLLCDEYHTNVGAWKVLRLLEAEPPFTPAVSRNISQPDLNSLTACGVLERGSDFEFYFSDRFKLDFSSWLDRHYRTIGPDELPVVANALIPDFLVYRGKSYVRNPAVEGQSEDPSTRMDVN